MYKFNVEVWEPFKWRGCYDAARVESKPVSVLIGLAGKDTLLELKIVVCLNFPSCKCDAGVNETTKFNPVAKLVLHDCTSEPIKTHDWTEKSPIVRAFRSPTDYGINKQSSVIVIMGSGDLSTL